MNRMMALFLSILLLATMATSAMPDVSASKAEVQAATKENPAVDYFYAVPDDLIYPQLSQEILAADTEVLVDAVCNRGIV